MCYMMRHERSSASLDDILKIIINGYTVFHSRPDLSFLDLVYHSPTQSVIPAKAGIQSTKPILDSRVKPENDKGINPRGNHIPKTYRLFLGARQPLSAC